MWYYPKPLALFLHNPPKLLRLTLSFTLDLLDKKGSSGLSEKKEEKGIIQLYLYSLKRLPSLYVFISE